MVSIFKKFAFYIFLALSIGAAIWAYFNLKESKAPKASVIEHIPANASCVIQTQDVHDLILQLTRQNLIWNSLLTEEPFSQAHKAIHYLDSLTKTSQGISELLNNNTVYWSFVKEGANTEHLIQFKLKEQKDDKLVERFFNSAFVKNASVSSFIAYDLTINNTKWLASCINGIVYFCSDLSLLQKSIQLVKKESFAENKNYIDLLKLNGRQKNHIYINHLFSGVFNSNLFKRQSLFNLEIELNELTATGYTIADTNSFFGIAGKQQETEFHSFEKFPDHAASLISIAISNADLFYTETEKFLTHPVLKKNETAWKMVVDSALYNIKQEAYENIDGELTAANYWFENSSEQLIGIKIKDAEKAKQFLSFMSDSIISINDIKIYKIKTTCSTLFSFNEESAQMKYGCVIEDNLCLMQDKTMLNYYLESLKNSSILGKSKEFMNYANDNLSQTCNYLYYENCTAAKLSALPRLINFGALNTGDALSHISLSVKAYKTGLQIRINAMHKQEQSTRESNKDILWSFTADSTLSGNAYIFTNHLTQENELCFQDDNNILYLINSTGTALWKKEINEHLQSKIYTVDIFKNGKFQLLFNTENYLHLIDRNGNYVQGYPVKLPQKATSPMTLLDYDNIKDYRILIACADRKIYNFSLYGVKTEGFIPVKTDAEVKLPVYYTKVGAGDYLMTTDIAGKIYVFSRKGAGRIDFKNKTIAGLTHLYVSAGNNLDNTKLIYVDDKNNLLNKISLSDKKEAIKLGDELTGFNTNFDLLNDDKQMDMILFGDGAVYAYDLFSGKLLESFNDRAVYKDANLAYTENNQLIIAFDKAGEKLDLIDLTGKLVYSIPNMTHEPLLTELYKDGKKYLVTFSHNKVNCIRLN